MVQEYKAEVFCDHTLHPLQEDVGLVSQPMPFYTNDNKFVSALLKGCVAVKKQQWPMFNTKVKKYVDDLQNKMERLLSTKRMWTIPLEAYIQISWYP